MQKSHNPPIKQSDSTRAKALELEIQNRVAQELQRLREREQQTLAEIEKRISESKDTTSLPVTAATAPLAPSTSGYPAGSLNLDAHRGSPSPAAITTPFLQSPRRRSPLPLHSLSLSAMSRATL